MNDRIRVAPLALAAALLCTAGAAGASQEGHREHRAHQHGHAKLDVAFEGGELYFELHAPGMDVVGFERKPATDEEKRAVDAAVSMLRDGHALFVPSPEAQCTLRDTVVTHGGDGHGASSRRAAKADQHTEFTATHYFRCRAPDKLEKVRVEVFGVLRGTAAIGVRVVTPARQFTTELRPGAAMLELAPR